MDEQENIDETTDALEAVEEVNSDSSKPKAFGIDQVYFIRLFQGMACFSIFGVFFFHGVNLGIIWMLLMLFFIWLIDPIEGSIALPI